jgi:hypothetical protein
MRAQVLCFYLQSTLVDKFFYAIVSLFRIPISYVALWPLHFFFPIIMPLAYRYELILPPRYPSRRLSYHKAISKVVL